MLNYLVIKALSAGFLAYIENNHVTIVLPMSFFGKDKSEVRVQVSNVKEYKAIMGDD